MNNRIITKGVYAVFKEYAYRVYLLGKEKNDSGIIDRYKEFVHREYLWNREGWERYSNSSFLYLSHLIGLCASRSYGKI